MAYFGSDALSVSTMRTSHVEGYLSRYAGTAALDVPMGNEERMKRFPKVSRSLSLEPLISLQDLADGKVIRNRVAGIFKHRGINGCYSLLRRLGLSDISLI